MNFNFNSTEQTQTQTFLTIKAMRKQEENNGYTISDYLAELPLPTMMMMTDTAAATSTAVVDASCRFVMATWMNTVCDYCNYNKETVEIALSCLDRFVMSQSSIILQDRHVYQLAAMTAFYISIKLNEEEVMDPNTISALSRGVHTSKSIIEMESTILVALQWRVHPPTSMSFVRLIVIQLNNLVSSTSSTNNDNNHSSITDSMKEIIIEDTKTEIETLVNEYDFCTYNASLIAVACLLNSMEENVENIGFYDKFEKIIIGTILDIDLCCVQDLRIEIQEFRLDTKCSTSTSNSGVGMRDATTDTTTTTTTATTMSPSNDNDNTIISKDKDGSNSNNGGGGFYSTSPRAVATTTANGVLC